MKLFCCLFFCRLILSPFFLPYSETNAVRDGTQSTIEMMLVVTQSHYLTVPEGGAVQIQCCWNKNLSRLTVNWKKEHSNIKYQSLLVTDSQCQKTPSNLTVGCNCSNLTITNVSRNDSGMYICKVNSEIPFFLQSTGNGTLIVVTESQGHVFVYRDCRDLCRNSSPVHLEEPSSLDSANSRSMLLHVEEKML
ncbi:hypothetical protein UPYG_G00242310 [Umbra pygmaea]|uniref:Ig-like domain-containing protein n=1 Tax=Umbra pygmaea TaxID=75934 RepID=A0ABD0WKE0_UMBPY